MLLRQSALVLLLLAAPHAHAQTAAEVLLTAAQAHEAALADARDLAAVYVVDGPLPADSLTTYYERAEQDEGGHPVILHGAWWHSGTAMQDRLAAAGIRTLAPAAGLRLLYDLCAETARLEAPDTLHGVPVHVVAIDDVAPFFEVLPSRDANAVGVSAPQGAVRLHIGREDGLLRRAEFTLEDALMDGPPRTFIATHVLSDYDATRLPGTMTLTLHDVITAQERETLQPLLAQMQQQVGELPDERRATGEAAVAMLRALLDDTFCLTATLTDLRRDEGEPAYLEGRMRRIR